MIYISEKSLRRMANYPLGRQPARRRDSQRLCIAARWWRRHGDDDGSDDGNGNKDDDGNSISSVSRLQMIRKQFEEVTGMDELKALWVGIPMADKPTYEQYKNAAKERIAGEK